MAPIRVLQVVGKMHYGGMETIIMNIYRNIDREKLQFDFLVHYEEAGQYDEEIRSLGGNIYKMPATTPQNYFKYKKALNKFFREHNEYVAIHGHLIRTAFLYHKIARKYGIKCFISHAHNNAVASGFINKLGTFTSKLAIKHTTDFFSCSDEATEFYFNKIPATVIKNGIQLEKYEYNPSTREALRKELNIQDKFVVGHIGRFSDQKNHTFMLDIFSKILQKNSNAVLALIGEGPNFEKIKEKASALGISQQVMFLGTKSNVYDYLQAMDAFLLPSLFEGLGIVLIEAQATGLPCITSKDVVSSLATVTPLITHVSLESSAEVWADKVLEHASCYTRTSHTKEVAQAGFDIVQQAKELQEFYISKSHKKVLVFGMTENYGGVESFIMSYFRNMDRSKITFDFLCYSDNPAYKDEILSLGGNIMVCPPQKRFFANRHFISRLKKHSLFEYEAVHLHLCSISDLTLVKAAKKAGVKKRIMHSHNTDFMGGKLRKYLHLYYKNKCYKYLTHFFACSPAAGKWFFGDKVLKMPTYKVINNAVNTEKFKFNTEVREDIRRELEMQDNVIYGHVGRFHFQKNHLFLLDIFAEVVKQQPEARLVLIGDGDEKENILAHAKKLGIFDKINLLGLKSNVCDYMQAMDMFLLPSLFEGLAIVLVEAQATGLPCVISEGIAPDYANIDDHMTSISLDTDPKIWAGKIIEINKQRDRSHMYEKTADAGFEITIEAKKLQDFYLK